MKNNTQSNQVLLNRPKENKKLTTIGIIISVMATALITSAAFCYIIIYKLNTQSDYQVTPQSNNTTVINATSSASTASSTIEIAHNIVATSTGDISTTTARLSDYLFIKFPMLDSPLYSELAKECSNFSDEGPSYGAIAYSDDVRLVRDGAEIVVPSLKQMIFEADKAQSNNDFASTCSSLFIGILPAKFSNDYIYINIQRYFYMGYLYADDLGALYRLDLKNRSLKKMTTVNGISKNDYKILEDGKRLVQWDRNGVYLINLETDLKTNLYIAPKNEWLVSSVEYEDEFGQFDYYNVQVNEARDGLAKWVTINVYDKNKTQDGETIIAPDEDEVSLESENWVREIDIIKPKFLERINIDI